MVVLGFIGLYEYFRADYVHQVFLENTMSKFTQLNEKYKERLAFCFFLPAVPYGLTAAITGNYVDPETSGNGRAFYADPYDAILVCTALTIIPVLPALTVLAIGIAILGLLLTALAACFEYPLAGISELSQRGYSI